MNVSLSEATSARLACAESGHWWPVAKDSIWKAARRRDGSLCYERIQECQRDGCQRKRKKRISPRTYVELSPYIYAGEQQKLGRVYRKDLNREQLKRQNRS